MISDAKHYQHLFADSVGSNHELEGRKSTVFRSDPIAERKNPMTNRREIVNPRAGSVLVREVREHKVLIFFGASEAPRFVARGDP
jgi:hypothetical protein